MIVHAQAPHLAWCPGRTAPSPPSGYATDIVSLIINAKKTNFSISFQLIIDSEGSLDSSRKIFSTVV